MDTFIDALRLHLFVSMPQTFCYLLFAFSFLNPQPDRLIRRLFIFTIAHSVYTDLLILLIPTYLHLLNTLFASIVLIVILFRDLPTRTRVIVFAGMIIFGILMDMILVSIATMMGVEDLKSLLRDNLNVAASIVYPQLTIVLIVAWLIRRRFSVKSLKLLTMNFKKTILNKIIMLVFIQTVTIGAIFTVKYSSDTNEQYILTALIYLTIIFSLTALVFMLRMLTQTHTNAIRSAQDVYVGDINDMFATVRGQRHDFLNHVQVIHTMAQMRKFDQLQAYTETLVQETQEVSDIMNHSAPVLAAFAQAKTTVALGYGIAFTCELPEEWNVPDSAINMLDLIKILGNLVDNAFDETRLLPTGQRSVHVSIRTAANEELTLEVANRGRPIDEETRARIFQAGYSTKGDGHSGLGLAIIQERVRHYGGSLSVESNSPAGTTTFSIRLPYSVRLAV